MLRPSQWPRHSKYHQSFARFFRGFSVCRSEVPYETSNLPTLELFKAVHFDQYPLVVRGGISHWPAISKWDLPYLESKFGEHIVPVEVGDSYLDPSLRRQEIPLGSYLRYLSLLHRDETPAELVYMAQAELPELLNCSLDIEVPVYCGKTGRGDRYATMAWIGPKGTVSPLHRDPYHNCFGQVHGAKRFLLYPPQNESLLYPRLDVQKNSSRVDPEMPDLAKYPLFCEAKAIEIVVEQGDLLYIPRRWWHHVRSLSRSISVSFWWL